MNKDYYVHPSSYIDEPAHIGAGTKIMHFCHIMANSIIGENCRIGRNVTIETAVIIGNNVVIENNVSLKSGVIIEDNVICGQSIVFTVAPTLKNRSIRPETGKINPTIVKTGTNIGANSTIICGNSLGSYVLVGAGSVIIESIPNFAFVYGNPAVSAGWACMCGEILNFRNSQAKCKVCSNRYFMTNGAVERIK